MWPLEGDPPSLLSSTHFRQPITVVPGDTTHSFGFHGHLPSFEIAYTIKKLCFLKEEDEEVLEEVTVSPQLRKKGIGKRVPGVWKVLW